MITELNLPNVIANGSLMIGSLTFAGWMFKKWMNDRELAEKNIRSELADKVVDVAARLEKTHHETSDGIIKSICELSSHVATTNGSIIRLKETTSEITTRCEERSKVFYKEAAKVSKKKK